LIKKLNAGQVVRELGKYTRRWRRSTFFATAGGKMQAQEALNKAVEFVK
jgi:hypothetical protein